MIRIIQRQGVQLIEYHVVTDLQMAGSKDAAVVGLLRRRFPKLAIVAMSGNHDLGDEAIARGADAFLPKPLRRGIIAERVGALARAPV